jgi:hypothetical protein
LFVSYELGMWMLDYGVGVARYTKRWKRPPDIINQCKERIKQSERERLEKKRFVPVSRVVPTRLGILCQ